MLGMGNTNDFCIRFHTANYKSNGILNLNAKMKPGKEWLQQT
jgi:hypothetical protein